jgi:Beta-galactosidase
LALAAAGAAGKLDVRTTNTQPHGRAMRIVLAAVALSILATAVSGPAQARANGFIGVVDPFATRCGGDLAKKRDCLSTKDLRRMHRAHLKIVRWGFRWDDVEPTKGAYQWGLTDATVGALANRGIQVVPVLTGSPAWAAPTFGTAPVGTAEGRDGWKRFLMAAVGRYGPGGEYWTDPTLYRSQFPGGSIRPIKTWQIWNEQNIRGGRQRVKPRKYARLVRISHDAIDAADPHAKILLGGMPGYIRTPAWTYLNKLYKRHGLKRDFDAVAVHPYSGDFGHVFVQIIKMRHVMRKHHDAHAGLWVTELGWGSKRPRKSQPINKGPRGQKVFLSAVFPLLQRYHRRWNLRHAFWYKWRDPATGSGGCTFCSSSGLFKHSQKPKPAWRAFKHITRPRH